MIETKPECTDGNIGPNEGFYGSSLVEGKFIISVQAERQMSIIEANVVTSIKTVTNRLEQSELINQQCWRQ